MHTRPFSRPDRRTDFADAVVTGAGSGIGRAFALELARRGGRVVCADIDAHGANATVEEITQFGGKALAAQCDVTNVEQVVDLADAAEEWFGSPTSLVVNNAGIGTGGDVIGQTPLADWHRTLEVNLWGVIHGCHVFVPRLRAAGRGGVINVASAASFAAAPRMGAYSASKAGVLALSETLSAELSGTGITVTALCPTLVKTKIVDNDAISHSAADLATTLMRWIGTPPHAIARTTLHAHDRGQLYVLPQLDAKIAWAIKRATPRTYTRALGLIERFIR
ncbi:MULTISPECIES: SDR family NAD(P)-dependent oxidoreductase [Mycobacteriaceae]|jgi:NAD(P)-dependent dehydrogenase (short-subunit alcohol dehydrogenase family)|uniref:SDR family NAD(P)-dependent oxidoreductase n=1 Tax=Mycobacteriaceae TaxID=1762 RepID=UPI0008DC9CE0|nr:MULTISPECIES: SDR family NAD(P)-dependent oxidoreductase [Mycobacteriaceae]MEE3065947.1 SDR family NAD(P)-dependent oxidoreductase [Actinomycetota bacterium]MCA2245549.1 SDR family NAD(P)-dependent oxidoreductase [Mycobacterium sp. WUMAC-067]MCA2317149.1 SDR family NAD(P)-dependent oxidoreductase [Mycobacterium sp. WUMAC-025]MCQ4364493.1 SDR family NAD(P)-dependent oxidoreductase [Mycobacterium gordonae]RUP25969.1 MAG: SDR family NAD(P)-dependent oxidoreductase [Mycolicibacterium sp.]